MFLLPPEWRTCYRHFQQQQQQHAEQLGCGGCAQDLESESRKINEMLESVGGAEQKAAQLMKGDTVMVTKGDLKNLMAR